MVLPIPISRMSLHQLDCTEGNVRLKGPGTFSSSQYSKYKHGSGNVGKAYASELCEAFLQRLPSLALSRHLIIASSPYKTIPTCSLCITQTFYSLLNQRRGLMGIPPGCSTGIKRVTLFPGDYGLLLAEQRVQCMRHNRLEFDHALLTGTDLVVVDDIKVTGAHQASIMTHARQLAVRSLTFLYVIECVDPRVAASYPQIEDRLNHASVHTLTAVIPIIRSPDFFFYENRGC